MNVKTRYAEECPRECTKEYGIRHRPTEYSLKVVRRMETERETLGSFEMKITQVHLQTGYTY